MIDELINELSQIVMWIILLAMFIGYVRTADKLEREAIENDFAYYDTKTKKFTWRHPK